MLSGSTSEWYSFFLGAGVKSTAVLAAAWALSILMRRSSAAARHLVWTAAFAALLTLPLLLIAVPALRVPVAGTFMATEALFHTSVTASATMLPSAAAPNSGQVAKAGSAPSRPDWPWVLVLLWVSGACVALAHLLFGWVVLRKVRRDANVLNSPTLAASKARLESRVRWIFSKPAVETCR